MPAHRTSAPKSPCGGRQTKLPLAVIVGIAAGFAALIGFFVGLHGG